MGGCCESGAEGEEEGWWEGGGLPLCFEDGPFDCSGEHLGGIVVVCLAGDAVDVFLDLRDVFGAKLERD